jgi:hypothetical protein
MLFDKQLKKEGRRNEFERHKLQALNQRQKMVSILMLLNGNLIPLNNFVLHTSNVRKRMKGLEKQLALMLFFGYD